MHAKNSEGALILLAYPEEFVVMIPSWYKKPLEWINIVQDDMICAGHSACILVHIFSGILEYTDFGRYIAPFGKGRARTKTTDPEVEMDIRAIFSEDGKISNLPEIYRYIYDHPEKTHGAGTLYASVNYNINYQDARKFIEISNNNGSVPYGPFRKDGTNCSRYIMEVILRGMRSKSKRKILQIASSITASPLGNVFYGLEGSEIHKVTRDVIEVFTGSKFYQIIRHLFTKKENRTKNQLTRKDPGSGFQWLGGVGAGSWFKLEKNSSSKYIVTRLQPSGEMIFSKPFELIIGGFVYGESYKFVYDCNASWCTISQKGNFFILKSQRK